MKTIYLIRHSKSVKSKNLNFTNNITEQEKNEKLPLSVEGEKLAYNLSNFFENKIDELWSSNYERAISTAKYIAKVNNINININEDFNERKLGTDKNIDESFWLTQLYEDNAKPLNGESRYEVRTRMLKGLMNIIDNIEDNKTVAIVSHATAITFLLMNWCKLESATLEHKKRHLTFNNKDVINDSFNTPEVFKLEFENNELISVERVNI